MTADAGIVQQPPARAETSGSGSIKHKHSTSTVDSAKNPIIERLLANKLAKERAIVKQTSSLQEPANLNVCQVVSLELEI